MKIFSIIKRIMVKLSPIEEQRLLVKVSKMYYEEGLSQEDIILRLNLSRSKISRLLQQARDEGIVQITVNTPKHLFSKLETRLEKLFGLYEAIVVETHAGESQENIIRELGIAAAGYLERSVETTTTIGISWGSTLHGMVAALHSNRLPKTKVIQIIGGLGQPEAEVHATDLCHRLARSLGSQLTLLPAPGIVSTEQARDVLLADLFIQRAMSMFDHLDIAFVGIGTPAPESLLSSILSSTELEALLQNGAVGDIALRFFDIQGQPVQSEIDQRVIGITFAQLKRARRVVGISGGAEKFQSVLGALRGKLINVLITDSVTAEKLLL
jgi:DNA-binding transcriptional regulator LsrR (DeoR family)